MYSVIRVTLSDNYRQSEKKDILNIIGELLNDKDFDLDDEVSSFSLSSEISTHNHFIEIQKKLMVLISAKVPIPELQLVIDVAIDNSDLKNRNMWCVSIPMSLSKVMSDNSIELEITIYPKIDV